MQQGMRSGQRRGMLRLFAALLKVKFGPAGVDFMPRLEAIQQLETLEAAQDAIINASTPDEFDQFLNNLP